MKVYLSVLNTFREIKNKSPEEGAILSVLLKSEIFLLNGHSKVPVPSNGEKDGVLALPFPVVWIEASNSDPRIMSCLTEIAITDSENAMLMGILCSEISPGEYNFWTAFLKITDFDAATGSGYITLSKIPEENKKYAQNLFDFFLMLIHSPETCAGLEIIRSQKLKVGGTKKSPVKHMINRVIHIVQKSERESVTPIISGRKIEWSHSFSVRGHWRRVNTIGKDRGGNYSVQGFTFVNEFTKGEHEFIKKTRIVG